MRAARASGDLDRDQRVAVAVPRIIAFGEDLGNRLRAQDTTAFV